MSVRTFGALLASENKNYFYLMHLSYGQDKKQRKRLWELAIKEKMIGLDIRDSVTKNWVNLSNEEQKSVGQHWEKQFRLFCEQMHRGDYVVVLNGTFSLLGIGRITKSNYRYDRYLSDTENRNRFFDHYREDIDWLIKYAWDGQPLSEKLTFDGALVFIVTPKTRSSRWRVLTALRI